MKAMFGLGGLLVGIGVLVWLMGTKGGELDQAKQALDTQRQLQPELNQIAGHNTDGSGPASESATIEIQTNGGNINGALVTSVQADGAYATFWGLKENDFITQIGDDKLNGTQITSQEDVNNTMLDAYQHHRPVLVMRDGQQMTLPVAPAPQQPGHAGGVQNPARGPVDMLQRALNGSGAQVPTH